MPVGSFGGAGAAGVNDDELAPLPLRLAQMGHDVGGGADGVVAPHNDEFAVFHMVIGRGTTHAEGGINGRFCRRPTNGSFKLAGSKSVPKTAVAHIPLHHPQRAAVAIGQNRFRPIFGNDVAPTVANFGQRLLPANPLPIATSLCPHPPQRVLQPVGVVNAIQIGAHLGAKPPLRHGMVRVGIKIDGTAVFYFRNHTTRIGTIVGANTKRFCQHIIFLSQSI